MSKTFSPLGRVISHYCDVCGKKNPEMCMVHEHIWQSFGYQKKHILCFTCMEKKLGRHIELKDLVDCPVNEIIISVLNRGK
jgi:hypothetical protein